MPKKKASTEQTYKKPKRIISRFSTVDIGKFTALKRHRMREGKDAGCISPSVLKARLETWKAFKEMELPVARKSIFGKMRKGVKKTEERTVGKIANPTAIVFEKLKVIAPTDIPNHIPEILDIVKKISKGKYEYKWGAKNFGIDKNNKLKILHFPPLFRILGRPKHEKRFFNNLMTFLARNTGGASTLKNNEYSAKVKKYILESKDAELKKMASKWLKFNLEL